MLDYVEEVVKNKEPYKRILDKAKAKEMGAGGRIIVALNNADMMNRYSEPKLLEEIADVNLHIHGKFNYMEKNCRETAISDKEPVKALKKLD